MVELANQVKGVYGARMTGGGFGGCTVNLVAKDQVEELKRRVVVGYEEATKLKPDIFVCEPSDAAGEVTSDSAVGQGMK